MSVYKTQKKKIRSLNFESKVWKLFQNLLFEKYQKQTEIVEIIITWRAETPVGGLTTGNRKTFKLDCCVETFGDVVTETVYLNQKRNIWLLLIKNFFLRQRS